jgi:hypothetical protein
MPRAQEISADVFAAAQEIARRFFLLGGNVNGRERAGAIQHRELAGIAAVGFDPITGTAWNQRRRNDVTRHVARGQRALELEAAGTRFVTTLHRSLPTQPLDEPHNRGAVRWSEWSAGVR